MPFRWYVAQTYPNSEAAAERRLNRQFFATHLPRRTTRVPRRGKIMERAGPCFPGYLFVLLDLVGESWKSACYTRGVLRLLPISEHPLPVARRHLGGLSPPASSAARMPRQATGKAVEAFSGQIHAVDTKWTQNRSPGHSTLEVLILRA